MKKFIKLLLVGLLSMSLIGCSNDSSNSNETDESNSYTGNVMAEFEDDYDDTYHAFNTSIASENVKTVTFLDSFNTLSFEIDNVESYDISENGDGCVMLYAEYSQNDGLYDMYIVGEGGVYANDSCEELFAYFENCISISFNDCFFTSNATNMFDMFEGCESLINLDLSGFDTSNVTDMNCMFAGCVSLTDLDITIDKSSVEDDEDMFYNCPAGNNY